MRYLLFRHQNWKMGSKLKMLLMTKIVDMLARFYHSGSGVATKAAAIVSERREAGCAIV